MKKQPRVFLSYAIEDRKRVEEVYDSLVSEGFLPWMDSRDLKGGDIWESKLVETLEKSDFILIFLSKNSINKSGNFQSELKIALSLYSNKLPNEIFLIPVRLEPCNVPEMLSHIKCADLFAPNGWDGLLQSLKYQTGDNKAIKKTKKEIKKQNVSKKNTRFIFVAMPFNNTMSDVYIYGITRSVQTNGFTCERVDINSFTGSILGHIKDRINASTAVIADLTGGNPNVYLELGFAWGCKKTTILITQNIDQLHFDVRDQRCICYETIKDLEDKLTLELANLKSMRKI